MTDTTQPYRRRPNTKRMLQQYEPNSDLKETKKSTTAGPDRFESITTFEELVAALRIEKWDYLLIGDGSASTWEKEAGWASLLVQREPRTEVWHVGCSSFGTVTVAEMLAYQQPLIQLAHAQKSFDIKHVHVVTDSDYVAKMGVMAAGASGAHGELWQFYATLRRRGILLHWHWVSRDKLFWNKAAHKLANNARIRAIDLKRQQVEMIRGVQRQHDNRLKKQAKQQDTENTV